MGLKFAANLNFLFTEGSPNLGEKIRLAHRAGFRAVEIPFPSKDVQAEHIVNLKKETGIEVALINIALGSDDFRYGSACIPGAEKIFEQDLYQTVSLAKALDCKKIHIMSGMINSDLNDDYLKTYKRNLKFAAAYLENENIIGVIEPINKYAVPFYFMNCYETAINILREINSKHMKLMLDIFHLQHIRGNITKSFKELHDIIGHIQIAQVPNRNEPDSEGELNFPYVFSLVEASGYNDWIGCEYKPKGTTLEGLKWIENYGLKL